jgi:phage repressor protein C with HTH and peptisase S24 domain
MNWHTRLTEAREAMKLKKNAFAKRIGVSPATITQWETGATKKIEGSNLVKVCSILGIRAEWLLDGKLPMAANLENAGERNVTSALRRDGWKVYHLNGETSLLPDDLRANGAALAPDYRVQKGAAILYVFVRWSEFDAPEEVFTNSPSMVGIYVDQIDAGIAKLNERAAHFDSNQSSQQKPTILAVHPEDAQREDLVYVPESRIEFAAGNGRTVLYELIEDEEPASYRLSWFQNHRINPTKVRRFRVSGDSMEPFLYARDTILVNEEETSIVDGKLYAIRYGDELRVKYLRKLLDGTLVLHSVNPLYDDEKVSPELAQEHISIIGRVRDRSGTGGL